MQLVINSRGSYLRKKNNCFLIKNEDKVFEISVKKVDSILITTSAYFSTDAVKFAVDNNIDIIFLDHFGNPYGRVWHSKLGSTTLIRRKQLESSTGEKGLNLAKEWVICKIENKIDFLKNLVNSRPNKEKAINECVISLKKKIYMLQKMKGSLEEKRNSIMAIEGMAAKEYFEVLNHIIPERFKFNGRSRNPAKDEFNCLLNYGYGVLYSMVEKGCILSGLDPYLGFIHTDNYNKKSLVFDLIEMFRILVDKTVVYLFSKRKVKKEYFDQIKNGLSLNQEGKVVLMSALNETLEKKVRYRGRNIKNRNIIQFECHRIANNLLKQK
ncbi:MAG TPA: CRISPR-associated endonuclease Cas1 [Candidatus Atribacteria bacterium]|nr:CRISPR-associated endonuclease Cas1 [Candidatus Atribacteria bacterium]